MNGAAALRLKAGDLAPSLVLPLLAVAALPMMSFSTWLTLTVAGVAMGMMLFLMASGLTLIFGLMDVLNFAHGAFITLGAYVAVSVLAALAGWSVAEVLVAQSGGAAGRADRRDHRQRRARLSSSSASSSAASTARICARSSSPSAGSSSPSSSSSRCGAPNPLPLPKPASFRGSIVLGGAAIEKYRIIAVALGLAVYVALHFVLNRTRIGLLVRAGVENREMVEALGYRINRLFIGVFVAGTALAGMGGVMWGIYQELVTRAIGADMTILVFIILIIGGLGSVGGCFVGALLVGLLTNYVGFLAPKLALGSNILLMAAILLWRPRGLFPVAKE